MSIPIKRILADMPPERRARIKARADELRAELATLDEIRKSKGMTQVDLAREMGITQGAVSQAERSSDMLISTLRSHIETLGGTLDLVVRFPDRPPVSLDIGDIIDKSARAAAE